MQVPVISTERQGDILVIIVNNPPVNALGVAVRQQLDAAIADLANDPGLKAAVIRCDGRTFFAGADLTEPGKPAEPRVPTLANKIEASRKPVVAAIHGTALGGGCELAMACHYRIAVPSAQLGLPEVKLGILPGAGGTQRLPRIVGMELALEMATRGDPISAEAALAAGLLDRMAGEGRLVADAIAYAKDVADDRPLPRASEKRVTVEDGVFGAFRTENAERFRGFEAPAEIIAVLEETATLPYADGARREHAGFLKLAKGPQSAAMRHIFFAERKAAKIDGAPDDAQRRTINRVGVIGAGTMGCAISAHFLSAGIPVTIVELAREMLDRGAEAIRKNCEASAASRRSTAGPAEAAMGLLNPTLHFNALAQCDLVIEAANENMAVKERIFGRLDKIARPGAILASSTSYLNIDTIAAATSRPQDVLGMHFFSPANVMKLLEIVRGAKTAPDALATTMALAKRIGKVAVVTGACFGFIGNRMLISRQSEARKLLMDGATPQQIDKVHVDFGMPMGPFQMSDLAVEGRAGRMREASLRGHGGRRDPSVSSRVAEWTEAWRAKEGPARHEVTDAEIVERTLYPVVNEGARILQEGVAQRASDIDVVWVHGHGWPVYRGGPMFWADTVGLKAIVAGLERHGFAVAELLRDKAESGGRFRS
ncbi:3-hydroxyacyl-CoA dehydrogenase NAD-binding domain-containing protein [Sphingomonas flavalba]|uniref:3-hydroxyacyl-CoA dehydrogenase NAD-binding domain-containing protein n=1 Tax=Sphingomonas flavalba TaxID=2559804 RepID=UPI0039E1946E